MARRPNKSIQEILGQSDREFISFNIDDNNVNKELDKKITLVTEGFTTAKYCELSLRDRTRLSKENAQTICDYIIDMKREINPRLNTIKTTLQYNFSMSFANVLIIVHIITIITHSSNDILSAATTYSRISHHLSNYTNRKPIS